MIVGGAVFGLAWGLFWGESGAWVKWIGDTYVGLLQMTVLPYVAVSLMTNIGRLSLGQGGRLARAAFGFLVILWFIGPILLGALSIQSAVFLAIGAAIFRWEQY